MCTIFHRRGNCLEILQPVASQGKKPGQFFKSNQKKERLIISLGKPG